MVAHVSSSDWSLTWQGLKSRGGEERETACVWGGRRLDDEEFVEGVYFLDDLGTSRGRLYHRTPREATVALFHALRQKGHVIIADMHTHPGPWVGLSPTDEEHPIEYRRGLLALVLPFFARGEPNLRGVGAHEYLGDGRWRRLRAAETTKRIRIQP